MTQNTQTPFFDLPNGMRIQQANAHETSHLFKQIFVENQYFQHGIALPPHALVVDGGANIGLFSLYVLQQKPTATVVAVEPAPRTFQLLGANMASFKNAMAYNLALGQADATMPFTYFPNLSCGSGLYDDEDLRRIENIARNRVLENDQSPSILRGPEGRELLDYVIAEHLKRESVPVTVWTLSTLINRVGIEHIDLLKLDIEGKEYEALQGIQDAHWPMIDQLVIEVHDSPLMLPVLVDLLEKRAFIVTSVFERPHADARKGMLYAIRSSTK